MTGLFDDPPSPDIAAAPLAERMRPRTLDEVVGQDDLVGPGRPLREMLARDRLQSFILWGPPGTGKTTLARLVADLSSAAFVPFSAVLAGIREVRAIMTAAEEDRRRRGSRTVVFVDEIHRFNKAQQDAFLPHLEAGNIVLIGATTENPSFEVNAALLSRVRVFVLQPLSDEALRTVMRRALADEARGLGRLGLELSEAMLGRIARSAGGDARAALNLLQMLAAAAPEEDGRVAVDEALLERALQHRALLYDKSGEEHYNLVSALHKSMRNSDPDAALYWLARMAEAGEDPLYIARRLVRFASEDVGNADPQGLLVAIAARDAAHMLGYPEAKAALAQAVVYLATAPKSNAIDAAYRAAAEAATRELAAPVPLHLRNAPTRLMKQLDYGTGYRYAHDEAGGVADMECLPANLAGRTFYVPTDRGFEREIRRRLDGWKEIRRRRRER